MPNPTLLKIQSDINTNLLKKLTVDAQDLSALATSINNTLTSISPLIPEHYQKNNLALPNVPTPPNLSQINPNDDNYSTTLVEFHQDLAVFNNLINEKLEHLSYHSDRIGFDPYETYVDLPPLHPTHPSLESDFSGEFIKDKLTFGDVSPKDLSNLLLENNLILPPQFSDNDIAYLLPLHNQIRTMDESLISEADINSKRISVELRLAELEKAGLHSKDSLEEYKTIAGELDELKDSQSYHQTMADELQVSLSNFTHSPSLFNFPSDSTDNLAFDLDDIELLKKIEQAHFLSLGDSEEGNQFSLNRYSEKSSKFLQYLDSSIHSVLSNERLITNHKSSFHQYTPTENRVLQLNLVISDLEGADDVSVPYAQQLIDVSDILLGRTENSEAIFNLKDEQQKYLRELPKNKIIEHIVLDAYDVDNDTSDKIIAVIDSYLSNNGTFNPLIRINPSVSPEDVISIKNSLETIKDEVKNSQNPNKTIAEISDRTFYEAAVKRDYHTHLIIHNTSNRSPTETNENPFDGLYQLAENDNKSWEFPTHPISAHDMTLSRASQYLLDDFHAKLPPELLLNGDLDAEELSNKINHKQHSIVNKLYSDRESLLADGSENISQDILDRSPNQEPQSLWSNIKTLNPFSTDLEPISLATYFEKETNTIKVSVTNKYSH